ncbi:hypothetical protein BU25DRAFT_458434 [Macroventuria anomochaeta]|uniref:Uncharacterized protein n=1 Tax=Macroventuria anomochaeta TaxID=301207 RepID=A0ACB6S1Z3_9PLEO|nr:uncharacterized protein BU25DRAFT_458434 [Macroventuria anomochaeta]KAF2627537.1 hypothetical protein BU25DRAFT_458434 [Macroventuria anomochaeta]
MGPEALLVIDKGAYHSDPPELVPYTGRGESQRHIVNADGFTGSGVFAEFRECHGNPFVNPRLDDPVISSLIQFIFIIRDMRRYYYYNQADDVPSSVHLATLTQALHVATIRARLAMRGPVPQPRGGEAQGMQQLQVTIEPLLRTKRVVLVPASRVASNRTITNGDTANVVTTNGVTANGFTTNGAMTIGARANSEASSHATDDRSYS